MYNTTADGRRTESIVYWEEFRREFGFVKVSRVFECLCGVSGRDYASRNFAFPVVVAAHTHGPLLECHALLLDD